MVPFGNKANAEDDESKPSKFRGRATSAAVIAVVLFGGGATFVANQPASETSAPASAVEIIPACPVLYIYPSDGSERKVIVPNQSNCTEENAGKVTEVRMSESGRPTVTHSIR